MADRPIIFSAPMVRALLEGRKTQTRRVLKPQPPPSARYAGVRFATGLPDCWFFNPPFAVREVYAVGDRLWVREACRTHEPVNGRGKRVVRYKADDDYLRLPEGFGHWECKPRPSIHMPRWASRLTLTVTDVRVQRLQEISEGDAEAEGVDLERYVPVSDSAGLHSSGEAEPTDPVEEFRGLWNSLHGPAAWDANPWVCALTFTVERCNIDAARTPPEGE